MCSGALLWPPSRWRLPESIPYKLGANAFLMNLFHWISGYLSRINRAKPTSPLKILNLTREVVLAHRVEVADHGATRRKGLLGRSGLPAGQGLWIVPCESVHTFGMKFPIDLVYLDRKKKVKKVRSDVQPWRLSACLSAHSVLELASGTINTTRTRPGDRLEFSPALPVGDGQISPDASVPAAFIMPNPPTALPLVAPLGLFGPKVAELLWLPVSLGCLITSVQMIRTMHGSPRNQIHWLGYSFAPALSCLLSGQITIFILFGL